MEEGWRGRARVMLPLLGLQVASEYSRLDWKPPVTAGLILSNTLIYLRPGPLHRILPSIDRVWFNPYLIIKNKDLRRFLLSPFYHANEPHLVYNMMSLLWKGIQLETSIGSLEYVSMVSTLLCLSQTLTIFLSKSLLFFGYSVPYYNQYAVGFSGVLFAMKVVLNSYFDESYSNVYGITIPSKYAAWVELLLIELLVPGSSFIGHLGGILAGFLYLKLRGSFTGSDPIASLFRGFFRVLSWPLRVFRRSGARSSGRGRIGRPIRVRVWRCGLCTFDNSELAEVCEMCSTPRESVMSNESEGFERRERDLSVEELRQRRLQRFGR
ncbi:hypothetical protein LUZ60_013427 [Juncus effusus]|nr:hypothetical protein LUZ60_013427 [Juncus effusus]